MNDKRIYFVCGNDGSGKSTYLKVLEKSLKLRKQKLVVRHYYDDPIRRLARVFLRNGASQKHQKSIAVNRNKGNVILHLGYFVYLYIRLIWIRIRSVVIKETIYLYDRSFFDEMISMQIIGGYLFTEGSYRLAHRVVGACEYVYLDGDSEVKYSRIKVPDISYELYMQKESLYRDIFDSKNIFGESQISRKNTTVK